jgi:DNA adenine methylase
MANDRDHYYRCRARFNRLIRAGKADSKEAAELFYYLNRTGYNGLCRFNRSGEYNVPFGRHSTINYARDFAAYLPAMAAWEFSIGDFEAIELRQEDFVYADPPYDVEFTQYSKEGFGWENQVRLARWLARHDGPVVLSNQATDRIQRLYSDLGFELRFEPAPRMISCNGDRTKAIEVIATRNLPARPESPFPSSPFPSTGRRTGAKV